MSGATGTGGAGTGDDRHPPAESASITEGAYGAEAGSNRFREETTRGGTTMTRPADSFTPGGGAGQDRSQGQGQQYHPPQAYPAPPGNPPDSGAGQSARPDQTTQLRPQPGGRSKSEQPRQQVRRPRTGARTVPRTRKARLRVSKADPWSVMKVSFLLSIALGICTIVAVSVLWMVMDAMGVFASIGDTIGEATGTENDSGFDLQAFLSLPRVLTFTAIIAAIDVVLATALATLGAFMYNLSAGFVGGVELTLAEDE